MAEAGSYYFVDHAVSTAPASQQARPRQSKAQSSSWGALAARARRKVQRMVAGGRDAAVDAVRSGMEDPKDTGLELDLGAQLGAGSVERPRLERSATLRVKQFTVRKLNALGMKSGVVNRRYQLQLETAGVTIISSKYGRQYFPASAFVKLEPMRSRSLKMVIRAAADTDAPGTPGAPVPKEQMLTKHCRFRNRQFRDAFIHHVSSVRFTRIASTYALSPTNMLPARTPTQTAGASATGSDATTGRASEGAIQDGRPTLTRSGAYSAGDAAHEDAEFTESARPPSPVRHAGRHKTRRSRWGYAQCNIAAAASMPRPLLDGEMMLVPPHNIVGVLERQQNVRSRHVTLCCTNFRLLFLAHDAYAGVVAGHRDGEPTLTDDTAGLLLGQTGREGAVGSPHVQSGNRLPAAASCVLDVAWGSIRNVRRSADGSTTIVIKTVDPVQPRILMLPPTKGAELRLRSVFHHFVPHRVSGDDWTISVKRLLSALAFPPLEHPAVHGDLSAVSFAFSRAPGTDPEAGRTPAAIRKGWDIFDEETEFSRQCTAMHPSLGFQVDADNDVIDVPRERGGTYKVFRLLDNTTSDRDDAKHGHDSQSFEISPSYPAKLLVPRQATADCLNESASFRSRRRFPVVSWLHPRTGCLLLRSAQPSTGLRQNRCPADETLLGMYCDCTLRICNSHSLGASAEGRARARRPAMRIVDARSEIAAQANRALGKGTENDKDFTVFQGGIMYAHIANIHKVRSTFSSMQQLVASEDDAEWFSRLDESGWLKQLSLILTTACGITQQLEHGIEAANVLVHCSDGWDRTTQLVSLAMLLLDPYFRTLKGFCVLIQKEWCSFGHKFGDRVGALRHPEHSSSERSPIFFQWLEACWQVLRQMPHCFEFDERLLLYLADAVSSAQYGTFLFNNDSQRRNADAARQSPSVWGFVLSKRSRFINTLYRVPCAQITALKPRTQQRYLVLWESWWFRTSNDTDDSDECVTSGSEDDTASESSCSDEDGDSDGMGKAHADVTDPAQVVATPSPALGTNDRRASHAHVTPITVAESTVLLKEEGCGRRSNTIG